MRAKGYQTPVVVIIPFNKDIVTSSGGGEKGEYDFFSFSGVGDGFDNQGGEV